MYYEEDYHKVVRENEQVLGENATQRETIMALRATIERLREYAVHTPGCRWQWSLDHVCDCGYDELMADLGESNDGN